MNKAIFISIKPVHINKIILGTKEFEYRKYIPKKDFDTIFVYTTIPVGKIQYILKIDEVVEQPNKISIVSDGTEEFNRGDKPKYAYHISEIYELDSPLGLRELKSRFEFSPPQAYAYGGKYPRLMEKIIEKKKIKLR